MNTRATFSKCLRGRTYAGLLIPAAALLLGLGNKASAQMLNLYTFTQAAGTYTPITGGTLVVTNTIATITGNDSAVIDDFSYAPVSLPFTFNFNNAPYTSFRVNSNGWIHFGTFTGTTSTPISGTGAYSGAISAFGANLMGPQQSSGDVTSGSDTIKNIGNTSFCTVGASIIGTGIPAGTTITAFTANRIIISAPATSTGTGRTINWTSGEIRTEILGTAPNRVCVVQFKNMSRYNQENSGLNFQIRLSEGGGNPANQSIQVVYGTCFATTSSTAQVGLRGPTNAEYNNRTATTTWSATTAGASNSATVTIDNTAKPASGQTYTWNPPPNCAGRPSAGTIIPVTPCPGQNFQLASTAPLLTLGLTYQWQDSTPSGWQNSVGATATDRVFTTSVSAPTKFRLIMTCGPSGQSDTSVPYLVTPKTFIDCYCIPTYAIGSTANTIRNVRLKTLNNSSTGASPWYEDYTSQQPSPVAIPALTMGVTDTVHVTFSTNATNYSAVWVDFNHNGVFDVTEYFSQGTNAGASGTAHILITTPLNAKPGFTRMRIRGADRAAVLAPRACGATASSYGEAEDYYVHIDYPACTGGVNAGKAVSSVSSICVGYTVDIADTTHEHQRSQITWSWENSYDGGLSWSDIPNSTNKDTLNNILITGAVVYRLKMVCLVSGDTTYSVPAVITIKPPYMCYCYSQSDGGDADVSDIGAVVIGTLVNTTGGPHVQNPIAIRRRTDYTDIPTIMMNADGSYRLSVYHTQRNATHRDARVTVFIDYNNDLHYDAAALPTSERVYSAVTSPVNFYLDTIIKIPNAVIPNVPTGLRIILNEDLDPNAPANLGCGPYVSGETEDYVVQFRRTPSGVGGVKSFEEVSLYPNPTSGRFTIHAGAAAAMDKVTLQVTTITGQVLLQKSYAGIGAQFMEELDLGNAAKGIYFVALRSADGSRAVRKLIVR